MIETSAGDGHRQSRFTQLRGSLLCRRDAAASSARDVILWWEVRRIPYNLIVGTAGILTCVVAVGVGIAAETLFNSEFGMPDPPIFAVLAVLLYGILANVCYTGGWIFELVVRKLRPVDADRIAVTSFCLGLIFSVVLTLAPGILIAASSIFLLVRHIWHIR